ncbi:MAG: malto-oligosyltrehalose trehalohydrolase [Myxococcota bacterium]
MRRAHEMRFGARPLASGGARFELWAPAARAVELELEAGAAKRRVALEREAGGAWQLELPDVRAGARYRYRLDGELAVPDPASRFQPEGVFGPSELVDPSAFDWPDAHWRGRPFEQAVIYELHVGAFSATGDFAGVTRKLDHLSRLGVTALELMPLGEYPGERGWGYDGVLPFAPHHGYGRPDELKALVAEAHARSLMVFFDVVYNHFGPEGNWLSRYAPDFFTDRHPTPWGAAIDFGGPTSARVRDFFIQNALYWLEEFHGDGLRLDAVHSIHDDPERHFLDELAQTVRARFPAREVHLVLENDANEARYLGRDASGAPAAYTAQWNDDEHHALHVMLTREDAGYYRDYANAPLAQLGRCLVSGFAFQGETSRQRGGVARGEPSADLPPTAFVPFLQNHDQIGNRALGERLTSLCDPEALRAAVALLLLAPSPPLLFMGEEWGCTQVFPYFCDFSPELASRVREGRRAEFASFPEFAREIERIPDPGAEATFAAAVLRWDEAATPRARAWLRFYRRLLRMRAREIAPRLAGMRGGSGRFELFAVTGLRASWTLGDLATLSLRANLGPDPVPDPQPRGRGRRVFATHPGAASRLPVVLPPWAVVWTLRRASA